MNAFAFVSLGPGNSSVLDEQTTQHKKQPRVSSVGGNHYDSCKRSYFVWDN